MSISRRKFLGLTALCSTTLLAGNSHANEEGIDTDEVRGGLADSVVCLGCRKCEWACNQEHGLSDKDLSSFEDTSVFKKRRRPDKNSYTVINEYQNPDDPSKKYALKVQCMHCNEPDCMS